MTVPVGDVALPALWPPAGLLAGAMLVADRRRWTALLALAGGTMVLFAAIHQQPFIPAAILAFIWIVEAAGVAWLVRRNVRDTFALNRVSHTAMLILFGFVVPVAGGVLAALVLTAAGAPSLLVAWRSWALADAIGILTTAPLAAAIVASGLRVREALRSWKTVEFALVFAGTAVVAASVFSEALDPVIRVPAYVLPFLLWPAFRFGPAATSSTVLVVSLIGLWNTAQGQGPLALTDASTINIALRSQGAIAVAGGTLLLLASVVAERTRVAYENTVLVAELQQALAEVKTLRGFIPICAWCHKVRDDAGFWQQIEMYLDAHTDATFSHGICPSCADVAHDEIETHDPDRPAPLT